jgi:hypothetical protein
MMRKLVLNYLLEIHWPSPIEVSAEVDDILPYQQTSKGENNWDGMDKYYLLIVVAGGHIICHSTMLMAELLKHRCSRRILCNYRII